MLSSQTSTGWVQWSQSAAIHQCILSMDSGANQATYQARNAVNTRRNKFKDFWIVTMPLYSWHVLVRFNSVTVDRRSLVLHHERLRDFKSNCFSIVQMGFTKSLDRHTEMHLRLVGLD